MKSTINSAKKSRRGRPPVESEAVNVRMASQILENIDNWRRKQGDLPGRPEAIRRLVETALASAPQRQQRQKAALKASDLASEQIDRVLGREPATADQESRKQRLLKGPKEFRNVRRDQSKPKR